MEGASCLSLTRGFFQNDSNLYMKYLFQHHDFFDMILLLKENHVWIISSDSDCKFLKQVKKFIKEKKDNSPISQLHLVTTSRMHINVEEKLYMQVLKKANISNQDVIGMLTSDQLYNGSKIIRKWIDLFLNKVDIKEMFTRGFQITDILIKSYNLTKMEEEKVRRNLYYNSNKIALFSLKLVDN